MISKTLDNFILKQVFQQNIKQFFCNIIMLGNFQQYFNEFCYYRIKVVSVKR